MTTAETIPIPNEFDDSNDFWVHPIYTNYEANRNGIIRNVKRTKSIGNLNKHGDYHNSVNDNGKGKKFLSHRFIYECFHGIITDKRVADHINNIKTDNRLDNLQLITQRENTIKDNAGGKCLPPIKIKAINIETGDSFDYESIKKAGKDLMIGSGSICDIFKGLQKTAFSKKYKQRLRFKKNIKSKVYVKRYF